MKNEDLLIELGFTESEAFKIIRQGIDLRSLICTGYKFHGIYRHGWHSLSTLSKEEMLKPELETKSFFEVNV